MHHGDIAIGESMTGRSGHPSLQVRVVKAIFLLFTNLQYNELSP